MSTQEITNRPMRGGLFNRIMEKAVQPEPEIGMGGTVPHYTDRTAVTVVSVKKNKVGKIIIVNVTADKATRTDTNGMSDAQSYEYETNWLGWREVFSLRKNGAWVKYGESMSGGTRLVLGFRSAYHDYSF